MPVAEAGSARAKLMRVHNDLILGQCLYVAARLNLADPLAAGPRTVGELAAGAGANEGALYRVLRLLASEGMFAETAVQTFRNTESSELLRSDVPGSLKPLYLYWGSEFFYATFGEILYSVSTGEPSRTKLSGMDGFAYLRQQPELARDFDDAMTAVARSIAPSIAAAYDFGRWKTLMDVGGGNGILLANILHAHPMLHGVLADQEHVLERARKKGFLGGELESRVTMTPCDFFQAIPSGCRAYVMARVIHDWTDEQAKVILSNCRKAMPSDGALLLVEQGLGEPNQPAPGKYLDVVMLLLTGGRERTVEEYRALLASSGLRLNNVIMVENGFQVLEALPV